MSYFIIKQMNVEQNNKYCVDSEKLIYKQSYSSNIKKF